MNNLIKQINDAKLSGKQIRKYKTPELYQQILSKTKFLSETAKIKERVFCIENNITAQPVCLTCSGSILFQGPALGYRKYCSPKCAAINPTLKQNKIETNIRKYGAKTPAEGQQIKQKVKHYMAQTYGEGITCTQQLTYIREKTKQTNLEKYGTEHSNHRHLSQDVISKITNPEWLKEQHHKLEKPVYQLAQDLNVGSGLIEYHLNKLNIERKYFVNSFQEKELIEKIKTIYMGEIITNNRTTIPPYELDIVFPKLNLAIEYNGIFWHSELNQKDNCYHIKKTNKCKENNIRLIQIWENEWINSREIVISRIKNALNITDNVVYAKNTYVNIINSNESEIFLTTNHIHGNIHAQIRLGLFDKQTKNLLSVMTFGKSRFDDSQYEMYRFASLLNYNIVGGASKLFKFFIKNYNPKIVISYCDLRWDTGKLYEQLKFDFVNITKPNYYYFHQSNPYELYSRISFQKHKLKKKLKIFNYELSEWNNMQNNGYNRIWDCGQMKFAYTNHL